MLLLVFFEPQLIFVVNESERFEPNSYDVDFAQVWGMSGIWCSWHRQCDHIMYTHVHSGNLTNRRQFSPWKKMYFILERGHFQLCQITGGDSHSCFDERIGISLFDHSGHLNVDSLRNFITEDRRVAILRCYGLYTLHIFTPQVFDYSRCSVAEVQYVSYWSTSVGPSIETIQQKTIKKTSETSNFQWFRCWFMSFWSAFF